MSHRVWDWEDEGDGFVSLDFEDGAVEIWTWQSFDAAIVNGTVTIVTGDRGE